MKILKYMLVISILLLLPAYSYPSTLGSIRLSLIDGDVQIRTEDTEDWVPASINIPIKDGDRIWVPEGGKTELQLRDGTLLRLDEYTALEILTIEKDSYQFYLTEGRSYANFRGLEGTFLQIDTPISSIRAYDRAHFRVDVTPDGYTDIFVYSGYVNAENRDGSTRVDAGKTLSLREGTYAELSPLGPPDDWERWNRERDRKYAERRPPSRYLPDELQAYSSDFEGNGRWVHVREYGYVWTPTVVVSVGWAPYRVGRWVWMGGDYVWVSYEPWGWVPYHYGRWAFAASIGWCWVPPVRGAVFWGPGFVGWVRTPTYVSWVPLAPGEIYYGHGYYGPHSVNIAQVNITHIDVHKVVYKNVHVRNGVTVIHHDTFVKGKHVDFKVKENPFLKEKISIGRPDIKPERATVMPVVKEIPPTRRPPELIREIKVRELKEKRPLVREREASVLKPESRPKEMQLRIKEGKPVEREIEKFRERRPAERGVDKSREIKPAEKKAEKPEPGGKVEEKTREIKPSEKGEPGKPKEIKPPEKGEHGKPKETKPIERGEVEKPKEVKPADRVPGKIRESKPPEKGVEKTGPVEKGVEKPKESKPTEIGIERSKESKPPERGSEKIGEIRPPDKGKEKPGVIGKESKGSKEIKPSERGTEKIQKGVEKPGPVEKGIEKTRESRPTEGKVERQGESRHLEKGEQGQREPKEVEKEKEKPQR